MILPHVTIEHHETTYVPCNSMEYTLLMIFSTATVMTVKNTPLVYALGVLGFVFCSCYSCYYNIVTKMLG
jgi:hypothetical protein